MKMKDFNLTEGNILRKLLKVAAPIMATSFMQMTHNLIDMFWLSRLSSGAVAAAGSAGMYLWLSMALLFVGRMGSEIGVSQNVGRGNMDEAKNYGQNAFTLAAFLGIVYCLFAISGRGLLIGFFGIEDADVVIYAELYLAYVALAVPFFYVNAAMSGAFVGFGNTKLPFYATSGGVVINIILSPIFIFLLDMGVVGAAVSTTLSQMVVTVMFVISMMKYKNRPFEKFAFFVKPARKYINQIFRWGLPVAVESALFTMLTMTVTRFVAAFGVEALAVLRVGSQIEALSWLVGGGFASAVAAFAGQNFGAKKYDRIRSGFKISLQAMFLWGLIISLFMFFFAEQLMSIFFSDPLEVQMGREYLRIFAFMQIPTCMEGVAAGCFRGRGRTMRPSINSTVFNALRVVLSYYLSLTPLGLSGIWIGLAVGATLRGIFLIGWYIIDAKKMPKCKAIG